jgi:probable phosphoglycerate mutase
MQELKSRPGARLILIHHGEANCTVRGLVAGEHQCRGLTAKGHRQADAVALRLADEQHARQICAVYATSTARAVQTAQPIAEGLNVPLITELPNIDFGDAEGKTWASVLAAFDPPLALAPNLPMAPGAEPWSAWVARVGEHTDALAERHRGETVALVCHWETIVAIEQHIQGGSATLEHATMIVNHTSITQWEHRPLGDPAHRRWRWVRHCHNDILHRALDTVPGEVRAPWPSRRF